MSALTELLKKLAAGAERREGRIATDAEDTFAKHLPVRGEEVVIPTNPSIVDPLAELSTPPITDAPNFTMQDSTSLPGMMGHNQAQADYLANQASERAANANVNLPVLAGKADDVERGLVTTPTVIDADFERIVSGVKDPVTKSLMQKYGRKGLTAAGIGGLGLAGLNMMSGEEQPKVSAPVAPAAVQKEAPEELSEPIEEAAAKAGEKKAIAPSATRAPQSVPQELKPEVSSNVDALKKLLEIQFGDKTQNTVENLKKVQGNVNQNKLNNEAGRAISEFANAMTGIKGRKADLSAWDRRDQAADKQLVDHKEQIAAEKQDPDSAYSQGMRDYMKRYGVNVSGKASGADLEKVAPQIASAYEKDQALAQTKELTRERLKQQAFENQMRREDHGMDRDVKKAQIEALRGQKEEQATFKDFASLSKDLQEPYKARSGALGRAAQTIRQADAIDALMATGKLEGSFQLRELAASFDSMLRGGQTAVSSMNELVPHDMVGDAAKIKEWLTSAPAAQDRKPLLNLMKKLTDRERATAENQIKDAQIQVAAHRYPRLVGKPEFDNVLDSLGIKEDVYNTRSGKSASKTKDYLKKLTTVDDEAATVTVKRKSDGLTKTLPADQAKKFLDDPAYEKVK